MRTQVLKKTQNNTKADPVRSHRYSTLRYSHPIVQLQQKYGNQAVQRLLQSGHLQAKFTVGQPNDKYEQEADRVADQVMRMPAPKMQREINELDEDELEQGKIQTKPLGSTITPVIQRLCAGCEEELQRQPENEVEEEEEESLQAKEIPGQTPEVSNELEGTINSLRGGGQPLSNSAREYMEPRFGHDFSQVRVHTDSKANSVARSINARAFTLGQDIVFSSGQYVPGSSKGQHLLAHELTHVIQQKNTSGLSRKMIRRRELRGEDFPWQGVVANASWVWFRKHPNMAESSKKRALKKGTEIEITGKSGNWLKVKYNGVDGYMYKNYIIHKFEVEARKKVAGVCDKEPCRTQSGCTKRKCKKEAAVIAETYVSRVNKIRKPNQPNIGDKHWGWLCYQWAGLLTTEFNKLNLSCWKMNWVGLVGSSGSLLHNYIHVSLNNITPSGTTAPKRDCGMILDPWRTGDPIVYDVSWSWHKWNYIHDPSTNKGKSYDGTNWNSASYPPPWTPPEPAHSSTVKVP